MNDISLQEEEEHDEGHESESDDEETVLYNPKNLPLGWDGKVTVTIESLCTLTFAAASQRLSFVCSLESWGIYPAEGQTATYRAG